MLRLATILVLLALPVAAAAHDEAKTPPTGSMILDITRTPDPSRDRAFNESLRLDGPPPARPSLQGIVQPDGSVKYGNTTVIIHRDCPPGGEFFQPPALPGRRR